MNDESKDISIEHKCDWGPRPVGHFPTGEGKPYDFTFYNTTPIDPTKGHEVIYAPTRNGMTVLLSFLMKRSEP